MTDAEKMQFHLLDGNGRPCGVFDFAVQEYIKQHYKIFFLAGTPYFYENGAYKIDKSGTRLKTLIKKILLLLNRMQDYFSVVMRYRYLWMKKAMHCLNELF